MGTQIKSVGKLKIKSENLGFLGLDITSTGASFPTFRKKISASILMGQKFSEQSRFFAAIRITRNSINNENHRNNQILVITSKIGTRSVKRQKGNFAKRNEGEKEGLTFGKPGHRTTHFTRSQLT